MHSQVYPETLNPVARDVYKRQGFYVAEIQYADLRKALLEKYNINISEYSLRCHATVGKLIDSIWSEHIKYAL